MYFEIMKINEKTNYCRPIIILHNLKRLLYFTKNYIILTLIFGQKLYYL